MSRIASKRLQLPDVTLVMLETREHELARMAIEDCLDKVEFGKVLILTDRMLEFSSLTLSHGVYPTFQAVDDFSSKLGWCQSMWNDVPPLLDTSHALLIQWDSWVCDVSQWSDEFLEYDYVGAPWWYKDGLNVGNSGFCLTTTRLRRYLRANAIEYPCVSEAEDDLLSRKYRPRLQDRGFNWAPEKLAHKFAFECCRPDPEWRSFGFHGMFNWGEVLPPDRLRKRTKVAMKSDYITNPNGVIWRAFMNKHSDLVNELLLEAGEELTGANNGERLGVPVESVS